MEVKGAQPVGAELVGVLLSYVSGTLELPRSSFVRYNSQALGRNFLIKAVVNTVGGLLPSRRDFCWLPLLFFCSYSTNSD